MLATTTAAYAAEAEGEAPPAEEEEPQGWSYRGQIGGFFSSVVTRNRDESRDATIAGTTEALSYQVSVDGRVDWRRDPHHVEQILTASYGRIREEDSSWVENTDQIDYDGAYKYHLRKPHYCYAAWGFDSVFTGLPPEREPLDPATAKASAGYGQTYHWKDHPRMWDWRVGVRVQRTWGRGLGDEAREVKVGPEFVTRYESQPMEQLSWWVQYEAFSEFKDLGHITNLLTGSFDYQLMTYLTLKLSLRAYYETEPEDAETDIGYDEISVRQETLIGVAYSF